MPYPGGVLRLNVWRDILRGGGGGGGGGGGTSIPTTPVITKHYADD